MSTAFCSILLGRSVAMSTEVTKRHLEHENWGSNMRDCFIHSSQTLEKQQGMTTAFRSICLHKGHEYSSGTDDVNESSSDVDDDECCADVDGDVDDEGNG